MRVGDIEITPLVDGWFHSPPEYFGPDVTAEGHGDLFDANGMMHLPIGCFLVRSGEHTVLIDAGIGPIGANETFSGGELLDALHGAGASPSDIDAVVCSHLHIDHCGWLISRDERAPVFPNAQLWAGAGDWRSFVEERDGFMLDYIHDGLVALADAGRVTTLDGDRAVVPGLSTMAAPGHTPGHVVVVVSSGDERALLLGDSVTCPVQLDETDWTAMSDVDPALAARTRERLWKELEGDRTVGVGAHFPGLEFGRVLHGQGKRYWA